MAEQRSEPTKTPTPRPRRRAKPPAGVVGVKILPKDPRVARLDGLWPARARIQTATAGDGPTSARVAVVDYNADLDTRFAPAKLLKDGSGFKDIARLEGEKLLESFTFHQVNAWAIVEQTLTMLEHPKALGRPIPWASGAGRLLVLPHAGYQQNAFYDRGTGALHLFYFEGPKGEQVHTCLSHDIVAHELGHAVLDGLKPFYNEVTSAQTAGFHEYFGDAVAMMSSLDDGAVKELVSRGAPEKLDARNIVSAIASEFGAAIHGLEDEAYLRGAWNQKTMSDLTGTFEEHDWSEVLTGTYYDLLQYLYRRNLRDRPKATTAGHKQQRCVAALARAARQTANVMLRALDYCPPVDLQYDEYARAILRADEVAYPIDHYGIREELNRIFAARRILRSAPADDRERRELARALRTVDIDAITATPADAYRFVDRYRKELAIPYDANLSVHSLYRTQKLAGNGYRPPRERIIEFNWSEDVRLTGRRFGELAGTFMPLYCGATLVFDAYGNFLHASRVPATAKRREHLLDYAAYLKRSGSFNVSDGIRGLGSPARGNHKINGVIEGNRLRLHRNAAMRHAPVGGGR